MAIIANQLLKVKWLLPQQAHCTLVKTTQVWQVHIHNANGELISASPHDHSHQKQITIGTNMV